MSVPITVKSDTGKAIKITYMRHFSVCEKNNTRPLQPNNWGKVYDLGPTGAHFHRCISDDSLAQSAHFMHVLKEVYAINLLSLYSTDTSTLFLPSSLRSRIECLLHIRPSKNLTISMCWHIICDCKKPNLKFRPWRKSSPPPHPKYAKNGRYYTSELQVKKSC